MGLFQKLFGKRKKEKAIEAPITVSPAEEEIKPNEQKIQEDKKAIETSAPETKTETVKKEAPKSEKTQATPKKKEVPKADLLPGELPSIPTKPSVAKQIAEESEMPEEKQEAPKTNPIMDEIEEKEKAEPEEQKQDENAEKALPLPNAKKPITGCFEIKHSKDDRFVFNLYASNHVIVATSQVYSSAASALIGIRSVIANAESAPIEDQTLKDYKPLTYPKWEIYLDKGDSYRFRLNASNGFTVCHSQGYTSKANCKNGIESIRRSVKNAEIDKAYRQKEDATK